MFRPTVKQLALVAVAVLVSGGCGRGGATPAAPVAADAVDATVPEPVAVARATLDDTIARIDAALAEIDAAQAAADEHR